MPPVRRQHVARLAVQQTSQDRRAARRQTRRQIAGHRLQRTGQDVAEHQIVRPVQKDAPVVPAIGEDGAHQTMHAVEPRVLPRHADGPGLDVGRQHGAAQQLRRRHRQNTRTRPQIEDAHRPPPRRQMLQRQQTAARRVVLARTERHPGIEHQRHQAMRRGAGQMRAAQGEAASDPLFGKRGAGAFQPAIGLGGDIADLRRHACHKGGEGQGRGQLRLAGAHRAHPVQAPDAGSVIAEEPDRFARGGERRLMRFQRVLRHREADVLQLSGLLSHGSWVTST